jgi:hypothetical protein
MSARDVKILFKKGILFNQGDRENGCKRYELPSRSAALVVIGLPADFIYRIDKPDGVV